MFAKAVRSVSRFIFLPVDIQSFHLHLCSIVLSLLLCQRLGGCIYVGLVLALCNTNSDPDVDFGLWVTTTCQCVFNNRL